MTNTTFTQEVIEAVEQSKLWKVLNASAKSLYEKENRIPSKEEYQALRSVLICKVLLTDEKVKSIACQAMWKELQAQ